jgi:hypothetical protein
MLASLLASAVLFPAQWDPTKPITYEANALPARQVFADLSKLAGVHLQGTNEVLDEHYILHFENAPLGDVLKRLEYISYAKFEPTGGGLQLRRDPVQVTQNEKEVRATRLEAIKRSFKRFKKTLEKSAAFDPEAARQLALTANQINHGGNNSRTWQRQNEVQEKLPLGRAIDRVLLSLDPEVLLDIPPRRRVALSTTPTAAEYPLSDQITAILADLVKEQDLWAQAAQQYVADNDPEGIVYYGGYFGAQSKKSFRSASKAILFLTRWGRGSGVQAQLVIADAKGKILGTADASLDNGYDPTADDAKPAAQKPTQKPEPALPLSDRAKAAINLFAWGNRRPKAPDPSGALYAALCHPTTLDPDALVFGDCLLAMAQAHHESLAVLGDDEMAVSTGYYADNGKFNQQALRSGDAWYIPLEHKIEGGWYVGRPKDLRNHDESRVNRQALEVLMAELADSGQITIESAANFALQTESDNAQSLVRAYADGVSDGAGQIFQQNDWDALRFYGALNQAQRSNTQKQAFGRLDQTQTALAQRLVFGTYSRLNYQPDQQEMMSGSNDYWNSLLREPFESLPDGLPSNAYFTLKPERGDIILAEMQYGEWYQGLQMQEPESLAWMYYQSDHPTGDQTWRILSLQPANRRQINIEFTFSKSLNQFMQLVECKPSGKRSTDMKGLPAALQDRLKKQLEQVAKSMANNRMPVTVNNTETGSP